MSAASQATSGCHAPALWKRAHMRFSLPPPSLLFELSALLCLSADFSVSIRTLTSVPVEPCCSKQHLAGAPTTQVLGLPASPVSTPMAWFPVTLQQPTADGYRHSGQRCQPLCHKRELTAQQTPGGQAKGGHSSSGSSLSLSGFSHPSPQTSQTSRLLTSQQSQKPH